MWRLMIVYLIWFLITWAIYARLLIEDDRPEENLSDYAALAAFSAVIAAFWPITILFFPARIALNKLVALNDRQHRTWYSAGEGSPWAEVLIDDRKQFTQEIVARCRFCKYGPLNRISNRIGYEPCENEECQTVISMDEDMRVVLERLNNLPISTPNPFATSTNNPIITITPNIYGGTTTSNPTWTGNTTSTTATLDSYDQYPGQSLTEADYARRKADIADAVKENEEPWTDKDILAYMDKEKSA